ncbi:MAG: hypothetical protein ACI9NN_001977 [Bacteroidia bacterium]|jgi:hypothetical protein
MTFEAGKTSTIKVLFCHILLFSIEYRFLIAAVCMVSAFTNAYPVPSGRGGWIAIASTSSPALQCWVDMVKLKSKLKFNVKYIFNVISI